MDWIITIKQTSLSVMLISMFAYLWIDHTIFFLYTCLIFIDFITWVMKWIINKDLSSSKALNGFIKKFIILLLIFAIWIFAKISHLDAHMLLSWAFFWLSLSELYSIIANIYQIKTWERVKEYDALAIILKKLLCYIEWKINNLDNKK